MLTSERLPSMTLDHLTGREGEPLTEDEVSMNEGLVGLGLEPIRNRARPACPWPRPRPEQKGKDWFILLIQPQQEVRVYTQFKSYRINIRMPLVPSVTTRGVRRTKVTVYRPMMRGYLFVHESSLEEGMVHIRRSPAVHKFLQFGDGFATVPDAQMERVQHIEEELAKPKPIQSMWSVGETIRINEGPFSGLNATIIDLANGHRITVELPFMRRAVPMIMDTDQIEKL